MKGWIAGTLLATLTAAIVGMVAIAQEEPPDPTPEPATETTANVEVRVWQDVRDARSIYVSARPEDGSWATLGTIPLPLDDGHSSNGRFRYGDITVAVPVGGATKDVEVRVWQRVSDARSIYVSARPEGGSWSTLGTIALPLDDGHSSSGRFRYGDITVEVPVPLPSAPTATPTPTPTPTPWVDPRPADTYTLAQLAAMPAPRAPEAPPRPDHVMAMEFSASLAYVRPFLVEASRVSAVFSHTYNSRNYPVVCDALQENADILRCIYGSDAPLSPSGTSRLVFNDGHYDVQNGGVTFVSASLDGVVLVCEESSPASIYGYPSWWCYDPETYRAWEAARDRALAPPTDPLERYLRQQGDPPLWYDESPFERIGTSTTGVFRMEPYVTYEYKLEWHGESFENQAGHVPWLVRLQCVPIDRNGRVTISSDSPFPRSAVRYMVSGERLFFRQSTLCEFDIFIADWGNGTISISFAPMDDQ